jgi:hypothetical protein
LVLSNVYFRFVLALEDLPPTMPPDEVDEEQKTRTNKTKTIQRN